MPSTKPNMIDALRAKHDPHFQLAGKVERLEKDIPIQLAQLHKTLSKSFGMQRKTLVRVLGLEKRLAELETAEAAVEEVVEKIEEEVTDETPKEPEVTDETPKEPEVTDETPEGEDEIKKFNRHIGVYAFRKNTLINFSSLNRSKNEISQNLEGNRAIDNLIPIKMIKIDFHGISIDTEKDFIEAEKYLSKNA